MNIARSYGARGISFLAISSNDPVQYPQDSPEEMKHAVEMGYPFPYLFDATQEVARAFDAACTPDFSCMIPRVAFTIAVNWMTRVLSRIFRLPGTIFGMRSMCCVAAPHRNFSDPASAAISNGRPHESAVAWVHCSIAGGLEKAFEEADALGIDAMQIFTQNQRQWVNKVLSDEAIQSFKSAWKKSGQAYLLPLFITCLTWVRRTLPLFEICRCPRR